MVSRQVGCATLLDRFSTGVCSKLSNNGRGVDIRCASGTGMCLSSPCRVGSFLLGELERAQHSSVCGGVASVNPRESSLSVGVSNLSTHDFNSRKRRHSSTLSLGLDRSRVVGRVANSRPMVLLSSIVDRLSLAERSCVLGGVDKERIFVAYYSPGAILQLYRNGAFRVGGNKIVWYVF